MRRTISRRTFLRSAALGAAALGGAGLWTRSRRARAGAGEGPAVYVIAEPCIGVRDASCIEVCPTDAIYQGPGQYYIHRGECIACSACMSQCPVGAIYPAADLPEAWRGYVEKNRAFFAEDAKRG